MGSRRDFIRKASTSLAGLPLASRVKNPLIHSPKGLSLSDPDDWKLIRSMFPLTDRRTFFNNGTIGPSPYPVLEAVREKMKDLNEWGEYGGQEDSRQPVADLMNAKVEEISLTHNTTEGINIVAAGLPLKTGDEIIMTSHEHAGNALPWLNQARRKGFTIKVLEPALTRAENLNRVEDLITSRTRLIAVPHITCTTGVLFPIKQIATLASDRGVWSFFDGAHGPGTINLNVHDVGCDFYTSCGHKWLLGPAGTGFLYVRESSRDLLDPVAIGAYSDTGWEINTERQTLKGFVETAHRFDYGTQSAALSNGLKAAVQFHLSIGLDQIEQYSRSLATELIQRLMEMEGSLEVLTPIEKESRTTMVGFRFRELGYREFGKLASENRFRIRLVPESGLESIRISTHIYNNKEEIDRFHKIVKAAID